MNRLVFPLIALFSFPVMAAMSDVFWTNLPLTIVAAGGALASLGAFIVSIYTLRKGHETGKQVALIEKNTNSMSVALVKATEERAEMKGHIEGVKDEKAHQAVKAEARLEVQQPVERKPDEKP